MWLWRLEGKHSWMRNSRTARRGRRHNLPDGNESAGICRRRAAVQEESEMEGFARSRVEKGGVETSTEGRTLARSRRRRNRKRKLETQSEAIAAQRKRGLGCVRLRTHRRRVAQQDSWSHVGRAGLSRWNTRQGASKVGQREALLLAFVDKHAARLPFW